MGWWIVAALTVLYLVVRLVQMVHLFATRFLLEPSVPLPVKLGVLLALGGVTWGARILWKRYIGRSETSGHEV